MKNPSMAKLAKMAGSSRVAMKMKMEDKAAAKMKKEAAMKLKKESMAKFLPPAKKDPYAEAKKRDPKLDSYIKERSKHKKGTPEYNAQQNKINKAYGKGPTNRPTTTKPVDDKSTDNKPTDTKKDDKTTTTLTETKKKKGKFLKDTKVGKEFRRFGQSLKNLLTKKKPSATKMKKKSAMEMKKEAAMKMKKKAAMKMKKEAGMKMKKEAAMKMKKKEAMKMKKEAAMKMKKKGAMKMKKAPTKMKKASMAKLNPGFDKLPKEVQAKILKNKKK